MAKKVFETKQWLLLTEMFFKSETRVIRGEVADAGVVSWDKVENVTIPANKYVRAGSIVEKNWSPTYTQAAVKEGYIASVGTPKHFNLEDYYQETFKFMGTGNVAPLWQILQSFNIHTLEQVAENAVGQWPLISPEKGGKGIRVKDIFALFDDKMVDTWMKMAQDAIKES